MPLVSGMHDIGGQHLLVLERVDLRCTGSNLPIRCGLYRALHPAWQPVRPDRPMLGLHREHCLRNTVWGRNTTRRPPERLESYPAPLAAEQASPTQPACTAVLVSAVSLRPGTRPR